MTDRIAFVLPGQGSQRADMASAWLPGAAAMFEDWSDAADLDLVTVADDAERVAGSTRLAQPSIAAVSLAAHAALARLSAAVPDCDAAAGLDDKAIEKAQKQFDDSHLAVAVIEVQRPSPKIPAIEQSYSAGAACLGLLNAALAAGWGANWLTGWPSHDRSFVQEALGLGPAERVVGFVHIGTATAAPSDRPRPDVGTLITWAGA